MTAPEPLPPRVVAAEQQQASDDRCGTYAGVSAHHSRDEQLCGPCREAGAAYMAQWRRDHPRSHGFEMDKQAARNRALRRLARLHPAELRVLYDEELTKVTDPFPALRAAREAS